MISHTEQAVSTATISLTATEDTYYSNELIVSENTLIRMISGEMKIILPDVTYVLGAGDTILFPRNVLAKVMKTQKNGRSYKSVAIFLTREAMQQFFLKHNMKPVASQPAAMICVMEKHPLLDSLFNSLLPYFDLQSKLPESLAVAKVDESISILRLIDERMFNGLSNFQDPGKINLADFMEKNFMFNMPIDKFGFLTGRSLSTFKRDFKKAFSTTPQRWLTLKRLQLAHYQITEKKRRPVDVYPEAGFENLSHFSYAFKKQFGRSPSDTASEPG